MARDLEPSKKLMEIWGTDDINEARLRIDYVQFNVADVDRSKAFYGENTSQRHRLWASYCEFDDGRLKGGFCNVSTSRRPSSSSMPTTCRRPCRRLKAPAADRSPDLRLSGQQPFSFRRSRWIRTGGLDEGLIRRRRLAADDPASCETDQRTDDIAGQITQRRRRYRVLCTTLSSRRS